LWLDIGTYYVQLDPDRFQVPDATGLTDWFEEYLTRPATEDRFVRVADLDEDLVGLVSAAIEQPHEEARRQLFARARLASAHDPRSGGAHRFWRHGIGRRLLGAAEDWGRSRGARLVQLDTAINSPVSVRFYEQRMGYVRQSLVFHKRLA
jgi:GNAT superfamily N-acetyltransferase